MHPNFLSRFPHAPKPRHVLESLHHHSTFKEEKHEQIENTVVPILIKQPQESAKQLEHKKGSHNVLLIELKESWNRNFHGIVAPDEMRFLLFIFVEQSLSFLVKADGIFYRIGDGLERSAIVVPKHSFLHDFDVINSFKLAGLSLNALS